MESSFAGSVQLETQIAVNDHESLGTPGGVLQYVFRAISIALEELILVYSYRDTELSLFQRGERSFPSSIISGKCWSECS